MNVKDIGRLNTIKRDGNCLFRSVAEQVYCDRNLFESLRNSCVDFMEEEEKWFSEFFPDDVDYIKYIYNVNMVRGEEIMKSLHYQIYSNAHSKFMKNL